VNGSELVFAVVYAAETNIKDKATVTDISMESLTFYTIKYFVSNIPFLTIPISN